MDFVADFEKYKKQIQEYDKDALNDNVLDVLYKKDFYEKQLREQILAKVNLLNSKIGVASVLIMLDRVPLVGLPAEQEDMARLDIKKHYIEKLELDDVIKAFRFATRRDMSFVMLRLSPGKFIEFCKRVHVLKQKQPKIMTSGGHCYFDNHDVGDQDTRQSRLLIYSASTFGLQKSLDAVFDEIRKSKEKLPMWKLDDTRLGISNKKKIISQTVKDIQVKAKRGGWKYTIGISSPKTAYIKNPIIINLKIVK